ncbi:hypothetical protein BJ508DRAFT_169309 [Ascobolus immersus RN42]|uniref:Uncharacterized protein n=1 Tax=Ascobolus immersus RN42 TaxID=1160509 RepID=A0A3N4I702_ASCIM|nr:hypothetical protein BJ508DRAFT_169309 [Ascobolus immersus RN42]
MSKILHKSHYSFAILPENEILEDALKKTQYLSDSGPREGGPEFYPAAQTLPPVEKMERWTKKEFRDWLIHEAEDEPKTREAKALEWMLIQERGVKWRTTPERKDLSTVAEFGERISAIVNDCSVKNKQLIPQCGKVVGERIKLLLSRWPVKKNSWY